MYIDHTSDMGGAEHNLLNLVSTLRARGVHARVLTTPGGGLVERLREREIAVELFDLSERTRFVPRERVGSGLVRLLLGQLPELARVQADLRRRILASPVDLVQTNTLKAHVLGSLAVLGTGVPIVWHLQDLITQRGNSRPLLGALGALVRPRIVCISEAVRADLPPELARTARVIHNGIDDEGLRLRVSGRDVRSEFDIPAGAPLAVTVAHLIPWKGHRHLLAAARHLRGRFPELRYLLVGGEILQWKGQRQALGAEAERLGVADRVIFAGLRADVAELIAAADLLVLPSEHEPFGLALIEAMALGRPVVATAGGGVPEIVVDAQTGRLVPVADPQALAQGIAHFLEHPAQARCAGQAGRERVRAHFSLAAMAEQFLSFYGEIRDHSPA
jgi:glycosyltransferase involved in cell wall biosynthesis